MTFKMFDSFIEKISLDVITADFLLQIFLEVIFRLIRVTGALGTWVERKQLLFLNKNIPKKL
jgi:hypothetical protein